MQVYNSEFSLYVAGAISLGLIIYLGHFSALLRCQQRGIPKDDPRAAIGVNIFVFVMLQLVVVPALWFAVALGACVIIGGGGGHF